MLLAAISATLSFAQAPPNEPTKQKIAEAYRSKLSGVGPPILGLQGERWRIKEIRGWKLHRKRLSENRNPGIMTVKYKAVAKKNGSCAEYQITDTMPFPPDNVQLKPILVVEASGVTACR